MEMKNDQSFKTSKMLSTSSVTGSNKPSIHVRWSEVMVDEKIHITINGLLSNQKVSLLSTLIENRKNFASCGHYVADDQGQIDTFVHHSHGGSFTGIQPMGLFTSTKEPFGKSRLMKLDVTTPYDITLSIHDGHLDFEQLAKDFLESRVFPLAMTSLKRWYMARDVRRIFIHEGRLYGALFLPPGDGPFPGIVDVFGMAGGIVDYRAALLASHGFAALSLAYIGYEDLPNDPMDIETSYFTEAVDWLSHHPMITRGGVGMIGHCFGGNLCLMTAALSHQVKVVVSTNGNVFPILIGPHQFDDVTIQHCHFDLSNCTVTAEGIVEKDAFQGYNIKEHLIPIWQRDVKALIIVGEEDLCVDAQWSRDFEDAIPTEKKSNFRFVYYPGAGHLIEPPYSPHCKSSFIRFHNAVHLWGGDPKYHLPAQEDAWRKILAFLNAHLFTRSHL